MLKYQKKGLWKALSTLLAITMLLTSPIAITQAYALEDEQPTVTDLQSELPLVASERVQSNEVLASPEDDLPSGESATSPEISAMRPGAMLYRSPDIFVVETADDLRAVLNNLVDGDVIRLADNIDYTTNLAVGIWTKVTFDLGNYTLNITNTQNDGVGLVVGSGGDVGQQGFTGKLNVSGGSYGVRVAGGPDFAQAVVTNATARNSGGAGVSAVGNANAVALGNVSSYGAGAHASGIESSVLVHGEISARTFGAHSQNGGGITTKKGVTQIGEDGTGAYISGSQAGRIMIGGDIQAKDYIRFDDTFMTKGDGVADPTEPGYTKYTNGVRVVWVKGVIVPDDNVCEIDGIQYTTLDAALASAASGKTIKLLDDIVYEKSISGDGAIVVSGKTLTFDLVGYDLTIRNPTGTGLLVKDSANVTVNGTGTLTIDSLLAALNVSGSYFSTEGDMITTLKSSKYDGIYAIDSIVNIIDGSITAAGDGIYTAGANTQVYFRGPITVNGEADSNAHGVHLNGIDNIVEVSSAQGRINVIGGWGSGIYVENGGSVTVGGFETPAWVTSINDGITTLRKDNKATVTVYGDVTGGKNAINALGDAAIKVVGNVTSTAEAKRAVYAINSFADTGDEISIAITKNVEGPGGINLYGNSGTVSNVVTIIGDVNATGIGNETAGVYASYGSVAVAGNVSAPLSLGAEAGTNGQITIDGMLSGQSYVKVNNVPKTESDKDAVTTKEGYHTYTDQFANAIVWVKAATSSSSVCAIGGTEYDTLTDALAAVKTGQTIKLLKDINYDKDIIIDGKIVTFDVGSFTLNVTNTTSSHGIGLTVTNSGHINLVGTGEFNVTHISNSGESIGLMVHGGSSATVTNVKAVAGVGSGVYANGDGAVIHVLGNVEVTGSSAYGAKTWNAGLITIDGMLMTASRYIDIGGEYKAKTEGVEDLTKIGYIKYSDSKTTGVVWVKDSTPDGEKSHDAKLSSLSYSINGGKPIPITTFQNWVQTYRIDLPIDTPTNARIKLTGVTNHPAATMNLNNSAITLVGGEGRPYIMVTAEDGVSNAGYHVNFFAPYKINVFGGTSDKEWSVKDHPVTVTASIPEGKAFQKWTATGITLTVEQQVKNPLTFYMPGKTDISLTAHYQELPEGSYTITVQNDGNGTASVRPTTAEAGTEIILTASPNSGYVFKEWQVVKGSVSITANKFTMPSENVTVKAIFGETAVTTYTVTVNNGTGGGKYAKDVLVTIKADDRSGYDFDKWVVKSGTVTLTDSRSSIITFTMPAEAVIVEATYTKKSSDSSSGGSSVKTEGAITPKATEFDKNAEGTGNKDIKVTLNTGSYTLSDIKLKGKALVKSVDYTISGSTVTIKKEFLSGLDKGEHTFTFDMNEGSDLVLKLTVSETKKQGTKESIPFVDVTVSDWFADSVIWAYEKGLMSGTGTEPMQFSPHGNTTRGMVVTILYRLEGEPAAFGNPFDDVSVDAYYADAVRWAYAEKIVEGYGGGKYGPNDAITREQLAVILMNYAKLKGYDVSAVTSLAKNSDADTVSRWALEAMTWANAAGLINGGSSKLMPRDNAQRAQAAVILHRFHEMYVK